MQTHAPQPVPLRVDRPRTLSGLLALLLASACSPTAAGADDEGQQRGQPSGAACPENSTIDYENFGRAFMTAYCVRCHSSSLASSARNGAPSDHDFDTLDSIQSMHLEHIDANAAAGPLSTNATMPASGPQPSDADRYRLGEWLACGAP